MPSNGSSKLEVRTLLTGIAFGLWNWRVWADLGSGVPDGICLDAESAVWCATEHMAEGTRTGQVLTLEAPAPGAGWS